MTSIIANPETPNASSYMRKLCKHWSHKFEVEFDSNQGVIALGLAKVSLIAKENNLEIQITPDEGAAIERLKEVVERHVDRFAHKEGPLDYEWRPTA